MILSIYLVGAFVWFLMCWHVAVRDAVHKEWRLSEKEAFDVGLNFLIALTLGVIWPVTFPASLILGLRVRKIRKEQEQ